MPTNQVGSFSTDVVAYIAKKVLPVPQRTCVAYQFGDPLTLPKGRGATYTATRYNRVPVPQSPLAEGVPPIGESITLTQVNATAQQWGDKITLTDLTELEIYHPIFNQATRLLGLQVSETLDRNTFNTFNSGTQVNYVNSAGSRGALTTGNVLDVTTVQRTVTALKILGAYQFEGYEGETVKLMAEEGGKGMSESVRKNPHYVGIISHAAEADFRGNTVVQTAWQYSDVNKLYNSEVGEWAGITFCASNMLPNWVGKTQTTGSAGTSGSLAGSPTNYFVQVTGSDTSNQYESQIYSVSAAVSVTGPTGSISVTTPNVSGYTYNIYIGTTSSPTNLGLSAAGPTSGPNQGQAVQLPANTAVTITGVGLAQTPPAAPANGQTVWPTYIIGKGAYGQVVLDDISMTFLKDADKSDPLNQLRVVGWKIMYGCIILNQNFFARIESTSVFGSSFT